MKSRLIAVFLLALLSLFATAQEPGAANRWVTLTSGNQKSTLAGDSFQGSDYFAWAPVPLQPGGKYTLFAEWDDGKAMLGRDGSSRFPPAEHVGAPAIAYTQWQTRGLRE